MDQALSAENYIYEGIWTNWGRSPVSRLTLTLNSKNASILSPALAILISIAGSQLWRLVQFTLHQVRATSQARPMMYHQMQVTLRNSPTDLDTLCQLVRIGIAWRRLLPLLVLASWALFHFSLVVAFGLFSSLLLESNDEVLSRSPWCGTLNSTYWRTVFYSNTTNPDRVRLRTEYMEYLSSRFAAVQQHVDLCSRDNSNTCVVNTNRLNTLEWTSKHITNECPFNSSVCHPGAGMVVMDTGFLSSHSDLGFNAAKKDRVSLRMLAKCAPLDDTRYSSIWQNVSTSEGVKQVAEVSYGRSAYGTGNSTYRLWRKPLNCEQRLTTAPYILTSYFADPSSSFKENGSTFDPIPALQSPNADVSLMLLAYDDAYVAPVNDPWFSAQQATDNVTEFCTKDLKKVYVRDRPLTSLACTQQWQICNTDKQNVDSESCTPPLGLFQASKLFAASETPISLNDHQGATVSRIFDAANKATFYYLAWALPQTASLPLKARSSINAASTAVSAALPEDQWQLETKYWMEILLGYLQQNSIDLETGQFAVSTAYVNVIKPSRDHTDAFQDARYWLCQNQIIHSQAYRNFNFCALLVTSILCVSIIIFGLSVEDCAGWYRGRRSRHSLPLRKGRQDMWAMNSGLHLLRAVDELKNGTSWTLSKNGIPRTSPSYNLKPDDLMVGGHDVEEGNGIMTSAKSMQSAQDASHAWSSTECRSSKHAGYPVTSRGKDNTLVSSLSPDDPEYNFRNHIDGYEDITGFESMPHISVGVNSYPYNALTFSNFVQSSTDATCHSRSEGAEQWPWFDQASMSSRAEYSNTNVSRSDMYLPDDARQLRDAKDTIGRAVSG